MQPDPKDPAPGVDGSITDYQISVTGIPPIDMTKDELCTDEKCSYEVDVPKDGSTEYSVSVAARNILGPGATTPVGPYSKCRYYVCALCFQQTPMAVSILDE